MSEGRKLRLLVTQECERKCAGCCNNDWDLEGLPVCHDYSPYDQVLITGGEPTLAPWRTLATIVDIRRESDADIFIYTARVGIDGMAMLLLFMSDGMTVTLHDQSDVLPWTSFAQSIHAHRSVEDSVSLRLNVFKGVEEGGVPEAWQVKRDIEWVENCPLPEGEVFMRTVNIGPEMRDAD